MKGSKSARRNNSSISNEDRQTSIPAKHTASKKESASMYKNIQAFQGKKIQSKDSGGQRTQYRPNAQGTAVSNLFWDPPQTGVTEKLDYDPITQDEVKFSAQDKFRALEEDDGGNAFFSVQGVQIPATRKEEAKVSPVKFRRQAQKNGHQTTLKQNNPLTPQKADKQNNVSTVYEDTESRQNYDIHAGMGIVSANSDDLKSNNIMNATAQFFRSNVSSSSTQRMQNSVISPKRMNTMKLDTANIIAGNEDTNIGEIPQEHEQDSQYDLVYDSENSPKRDVVKQAKKNSQVAMLSPTLSQMATYQSGEMRGHKLNQETSPYRRKTQVMSQSLGGFSSESRVQQAQRKSNMKKYKEHKQSAAGGEMVSIMVANTPLNIQELPYSQTSELSQAENLQLDKSKLQQFVLDQINMGSVVNFDEIMTGNQGTMTDILSEFEAAQLKHYHDYQRQGQNYPLRNGVLQEQAGYKFPLLPNQIELLKSPTEQTHLQKKLKPSISPKRYNNINVMPLKQVDFPSTEQLQELQTVVAQSKVMLGDSLSLTRDRFNLSNTFRKTGSSFVNSQLHIKQLQAKQQLLDREQAAAHELQPRELMQVHSIPAAAQTQSKKKLVFVKSPQHTVTQVAFVELKPHDSQDEFFHSTSREKFTTRSPSGLETDRFTNSPSMAYPPRFSPNKTSYHKLTVSSPDHINGNKTGNITPLKLERDSPKNKKRAKIVSKKKQSTIESPQRKTIHATSFYSAKHSQKTKDAAFQTSGPANWQTLKQNNIYMVTGENHLQAARKDTLLLKDHMGQSASSIVNLKGKESQGSIALMSDGVQASEGGGTVDTTDIGPHQLRLNPRFNGVARRSNGPTEPRTPHPGRNSTLSKKHAAVSPKNDGNVVVRKVHKDTAPMQIEVNSVHNLRKANPDRKSQETNLMIDTTYSELYNSLGSEVRKKAEQESQEEMESNQYKRFSPDDSMSSLPRIIKESNSGQIQPKITTEVDLCMEILQQMRKRHQPLTSQNATEQLKKDKTRKVNQDSKLAPRKEPFILLQDGETPEQKHDYFTYLKSKIEASGTGAKLPASIQKLAPIHKLREEQKIARALEVPEHILSKIEISQKKYLTQAQKDSLLQVSQSEAEWTNLGENPLMYSPGGSNLGSPDKTPVKWNHTSHNISTEQLMLTSPKKETKLPTVYINIKDKLKAQKLARKKISQSKSNESLDNTSESSKLTIQQIVNLAASQDFSLAKLGNNLKSVQELYNQQGKTQSILKGRTSSMAQKKRTKKKVMVNDSLATIKPLLATAQSLNFAPTSLSNIPPFQLQHNPTDPDTDEDICKHLDILSEQQPFDRFRSKEMSKQCTSTERLVDRRFLNRFNDAYNFSDEGITSDQKRRIQKGKRFLANSEMSGTVSKDWVLPESNPILMEICERLKEPENTQELLNKSLIVRPSDNFRKERKLRQHQTDVMYGTRPNASGLSVSPREVKIRQTDIEKALVQQKIAPHVPIHKMDKINRALTRSLMVEEHKKKFPEQFWRDKKVMLPILNMRNTEKTLHTAEVLTNDTINKQKKRYDGQLKTFDLQNHFERVPSIGMDDREMLLRNFIGKATRDRKTNQSMDVKSPKKLTYKEKQEMMRIQMNKSQVLREKTISKVFKKIVDTIEY